MMNREAFSHINEYVDNFEKKKDIDSRHVIKGEIVSPLVSFVVPTFNRTETLKETIESVLNQEKTEIEYELIILDNSGNHEDSNPTYQLLKKYIDPHIEYYQNEVNIGFEGNFNRGIELARGKWVSYIHDDDLITNDYLKKINFLLLKYNKKNDIGYIKTEVITFENSDNIPMKNEIYSKLGKASKKLWGRMKKLNKFDTLILGYSPTCIPSCGTLVLKKAILEIGGFNPDYYPSFDAYPGYQMIGKYKVFMTFEPLGYYRWSINVSLKKETIIGFLEANQYFRKYVYNENLLYSLYGWIFGDTYFSKNVDDWKYKANQHGMELSDQEIKYICDYKEHKCRKRTIIMIQSFYNRFKKLLSIIC